MNAAYLKLIFDARRKTFILVFILFLLVIGLYAFRSAYLEPRLADLQRIWSEKRFEASAGQLMDAATVYKRGTSDLALFRERILTKKEFAAFIGDLFETATNNNLKVGAITYKPSHIKEEKLLNYSIGFNVSGKYAAIKSFISDIERIRQIAVIDNISLNGKSDEESVDMRVQMTAYFRAEGQ